MLKLCVLITSMLLLDGIWIGGFMGPLYQQHLGSFLQVSTGYRLAIGLLLAYGLMVVGLLTFVLVPESSLYTAAIFGAVLYGVFAFTNYVIFANWPIILVIADIVWGTFLYALLWYIAKSIAYI